METGSSPAGAPAPLRVVLTTVPDVETGARLGRAAVEEGLAACVSLVPGVRSIYRWQGRVEDEAEVLLVAKVRADRLAAYEARVAALHPYEVPEIVALAAERVFEPYLRWAQGEA